MAKTRTLEIIEILSKRLGYKIEEYRDDSGSLRRRCVYPKCSDFKAGNEGSKPSDS